MEEIFNRNSNINYSLHDFDENPGEKEAIRIAKRKALQTLYSVDDITEIGSGSEGRTTVYKVDQDAVKVIFCQVERYSGEKLKEEEKSFLHKVKENLSSRPTLINEIKCWITVTKSANNIIPMYGFKLFSWVCPEYNRIGVDCAVEMALAECMADLKKKPESQDDILQVGIDLSTALIALHKNNLIHRDIKPANIFLYDEKFCLGDFGIAIDRNNPQYLQGGYHREEDAKGTHAYAAPEQEKGEQVDYRADIYSLGLVLYELADTAPMSSHYCDRIHKYQLPELASNVSVSEGLKIILRNACEYQKEYRYQTAEEFKEDLCRLKNNPNYIPKSTRTKFEQKNKTPNAFHRLGAESSSNALPPNSRFRKFGVNSQQNLERYLTPETAWNAGKFWYEESCKSGSRFNGLDIDKKIMPLTSSETYITDLPVNVTMDPEDSSDPIPLYKILEHPETIHNMYLIGEGGIGKTTALHSIMKDTYNNQDFIPATSDKQLVIPLFIELSKAPSGYCGAYRYKQSTFIQRYLFMLIGSLSENHLIFENSYEMTAGMEKEADSIIKNIRFLLNNADSNVKYLLLLDGLNEVSRKRLFDNENNYIGTPSELIIDEIQELLRYQNVSVIITSRADETLGALDDEFNRLYLTGVGKQDVEEYLSKHEISYAAIEDNKRLMETLKIPLFLKLYSQLYSVSGVSTPGEILYAFFSERSMQYSARGRITEIEKERRISGNTHSDNLINEKMQWFILDFLLPELGWYMEKNDLYTVDQATIKNVMDNVLKETGENNICGKYGIAMFSDYHNGKDGSINVKTYADQLLALESVNRSYVQEIVDYCVYSLGILYVNNQDYGFIHQHIRDFFAAMKIITNMKMTLYISKYYNISTNPIQNLTIINNDILSHTVIQYVGEILHEHLQSITNQNTSLPQKILSLYRNIFFSEYAEEYGVWNLIRILYESHRNLSGMNLSYLDLRNCSLNGIELFNADLSGCAINHDSIFENVHSDAVQCVQYSKNGKYIYSGDRSGFFKIWHAKTSKCLKTIKKYAGAITNISLNENYIAVSTSNNIIELLDITTYNVLHQYCAQNAVFTPSEKYLVIFYKKKKVQVLDLETFKVIGNLGHTYNPFISNNNMISFTSDSKYIAFVTSDYYNTFSKKSVEIWNLETMTHVLSLYDQDDPYERISAIDFNPNGSYIAIALYRTDINIYSLHLESNTFALSGRFELKKHWTDRICKVPVSLKYVSQNCLVIGDRDGGMHFFNLHYLEHSLAEQFHFYRHAHSFTISCLSVFYNCEQVYMAAGDDDGNIKIWDLVQKKILVDLEIKNNKYIIASYYMCSTQEIVMCTRQEVLTFNLKTNIVSSILSHEFSKIQYIDYNDVQRTLAIVHDNYIIGIYRYVKHFEFKKNIYIRWNKKIKSIKFSTNGKVLLIIDDEKCIYRYNFDNSSLDIPIFLGEPAIEIILSGDNILGLTSSDVLVYNALSDVTISDAQHFRINSIPASNSSIYSFTGDTINYSDVKLNYIALAGGRIYKLNASAKEYDLSFSIKDKSPNACPIYLSPDESLLAVSNDLDSIRIYDTITKKYLYNIHVYSKRAKIIPPLPIKEMFNYYIYLLHYNKCSIISIFEYTLYDILDNFETFFDSLKKYMLYNANKKNNVYTDCFITSLCFIPETEYILTASTKGELKLWKPIKSFVINNRKSLNCCRTIKYIPGLKIKGAKFECLNKESNLTPEDIHDLQIYGAIIDDK